MANEGAAPATCLVTTSPPHQRFKPGTISRGVYSPFKIKQSNYKPTRSVSPELLHRPRSAKLQAAVLEFSGFKAKHLTKRRTSTPSSHPHSYARPGTDSRRKSANIASKPIAAITQPHPFNLKCDALMIARKEKEIERIQRQSIAEESKRQLSIEEQKIKDREIVKELNRHMFKARPLPKFIAQKKQV